MTALTASFWSWARWMAGAERTVAARVGERVRARMRVGTGLVVGSAGPRRRGPRPARMMVKGWEAWMPAAVMPVQSAGREEGVGKRVVFRSEVVPAGVRGGEVGMEGRGAHPCRCGGGGWLMNGRVGGGCGKERRRCCKPLS